MNFLEQLPEAWQEHLNRLGQPVTYHGAQRIFDEGGPAEHFWIIREGAVNLDLHVPGRDDVLIETLRPGAVLGWSWLFPPHRWHFGAVAARTTYTTQLRGEDVMRICQEDPALGMELMRQFMGVAVDRLQATRLRLLDLYGYAP
jgi:CRP/FNR family cyclic AMP-dependent transcriptional regulator